MKDTFVRRMTVAVWLAAALVLAGAMLTACESVGLPTPTSWNERVATALGTVTEVRNQAATLLMAQVISVDDAENVLRQTDAAAAAIAVARQMQATDPTGANQKLLATTTVLRALQQYLLAKQQNRVPPPPAVVTPTSLKGLA